MVQLNFSARNFQPAAVGGESLPVSDDNGHPVVITASEQKLTKASAEALARGDNSPNKEWLLELKLLVIDGPHKGATGPYRLNLGNANPQAVDIANRQLAAVCFVTGVFDVRDSSQLHNIPFRVVVGNQPFTETQLKAKQADPSITLTPYTQVRGVKDINGNDPGKSGGGGAPQPQQQAQPAFQPQQPQQPQQPAFQPQQPQQQQSPFAVQPGGFQPQQQPQTPQQPQPQFQPQQPQQPQFQQPQQQQPQFQQPQQPAFQPNPNGAAQPPWAQQRQ